MTLAMQPVQAEPPAETRRSVVGRTGATDRVYRTALRVAAVLVLLIMTTIGLFLLLRGSTALGRAGLSLLLVIACNTPPAAPPSERPCSALDPTSTRRIEQTIAELRREVTIVIVTHNMQQAARVSQQCAFFLAEQGTPGVIVEEGPTDVMFHSPSDPRTSDYVNGRFG